MPRAAAPACGSSPKERSITGVSCASPPARATASASGSSSWPHSTRREAEDRLRELIDEVQHVSNPSRTIADAGNALLEHLEATGRSKSHLETAESHLRVHIVPAFGRIAIDRLDEERITRLVATLRRNGKAPKTIRNILSTLHSVCELAMRRRWCSTNPCRFLDAPRPAESSDIRYLTQRELGLVLDTGIP